MEISKLKEEIKELKRQRGNEEEMRKEVKKLQEERTNMLMEMATLKKLVQDLCNAPIPYPSLAARPSTGEKKEVKKGKPTIKEIIKIPPTTVTPAMKGIVEGMGKMTVEEANGERKRIDITRTVNKIRESQGVRMDISRRKVEGNSGGKKQVPGTNETSRDQGKNREGEMIPGNKGGNQEEVWSKVVGRKANKTGQTNNDNRGNTSGVRNSGITTIRKGKEPSTAAIIMNCIPGKGNEIMREARRKINLQELGIEEGMVCRKAITGATVFEIAGKDREKKAKKLEEKLRETFTGRQEVKVYRPVKMEVKITNMEESTASGEIIEAVIKIGGCRFTEVKIGGMKVNGNGLATAWIKCPMITANVMIEEGGIKIGWVRANVTLIKARLLQCYRCLEFGHVRQYCRGEENNDDRCYRCGSRGHRAAQCEEKAPRCYICEKRGKNSEHGMGGPACHEAKIKGWRPPSRGVMNRGEERDKLVSTGGRGNKTQKDKIKGR